MEKKLAMPLAAHGAGEGMWARPWRWAKTAFFLASMLASLLLVCAPPLLVVLLDLLLPPALLSSFLRAHHHTLLDQARGFHFRSSLVDLPAVSAARSLLILCAYTACGGDAAYLWVAAACSVGSLCYVLAKAVAVFGVAAAAGGWSCRGRGSSPPSRPCSSSRSRSPPRTSPWPTGPAAARGAASTSSTESTSKP